MPSDGGPGWIPLRGSSLSDLAAGHLQGPARTRTTYSDHLLSLVLREYQSLPTTQSPFGDAPWPDTSSRPRSSSSGAIGASPESAEISTGPSAAGASPATTADVDASDSTTSATA